jgi:hypothetical protein
VFEDEHDTAKEIRIDQVGHCHQQSTGQRFHTHSLARSLSFLPSLEGKE